MAFSTMHFGTGMACAGVAAAGVCLIARRGWRWVPAVATIGGAWAMVPDMPRIFREDFPNFPLAGLLGAKGLERWLHSIGNVFCFHGSLDAQPREFALLGLTMIVGGYTMFIAQLMWLEHRQRNSIGNRSWRAHEAHLRRRKRKIAHEAFEIQNDEPRRIEEPPKPVYNGDGVIRKIGPDVDKGEAV